MPRIVNGAETPQNQNENPENGFNQFEQNESPTSDNGFSQPENEYVNIPQDESYTATPQIVNQKVPIVVFVGPPSSGKSMILVRLAKYLRSQGYTVKTDPTLLNTASYQADCEEFKNKLNTTIALDGSVKFLLVNIYKDGEEIAKLLEAPGEDFYTTDPQKIKAGKNNRVETYLNAIMTSNNPKSYVVLLDLDSDISFRNDSSHREAYAERFLDCFYPAIDINRDRIVLLYNKIDDTPFGTINGCTNPEGAREDAKLYYPQLFSTMRVKKWGGFLTVDNFAFMTFCTGKFSKEIRPDGSSFKSYYVASDVYPKDLWKEIIKKW